MFRNIMEALVQVLSCPVCLELFTPPVLVLSCAHNFCKKCLEKILTLQNCSHVNGHFCCPMCRKIVYLRGGGLTGLPRNILAENVVEKFKYELELFHAREQDRLSQICEEHGEKMTLVCLTDDKPICAICKLFGDHESHTVAKIAEVYAERKKSFMKGLDWVCQQSEYAEQARKEIEVKITELVYTNTGIKIMIEAVGNSLIKGIRCRMAELKGELHKDYSTKLEKLQLLANDFQVPTHLYHQMKAFLEKHTTSVCFLQEDKIFRSKLEKLTEGKPVQQDTNGCNISIGHYFKNLIKGISINNYISCNSDETLASSSEPPEAFKLECPAFSFSGGISNEHFCQEVLDFFQKSSKMKQEPNQHISHSEGNNTPRKTDLPLEAK
ncbi:PREDICTED: tripartite motif-containing protein 54-like [Thamnophis sirtalis]|uniref:Tripartite motif-containing protein 54-like n=1 Tax=Thamnophis sirtalis TaxID=35019 RepID=A0A6I9XE29_9SAUR|nr:PREDICTED: tripartite motif-containing protein 54-like [Thamnophis sirtalis]